MNTQSLECAINCDQDLSAYITGVYASDQMPQKPTSYPFVFIVNSDPHYLPGRHWVAYFIASPTADIEFFDSYAHRPSFYNKAFTDFVHRNKRNIKYNHKRLQSEYSKVCGQYVFYLLNRCKNVPYATVFDRFSDDFAVNDVFVMEYIKNVFPLCFRKGTIQSQSCIALCY